MQRIKFITIILTLSLLLLSIIFYIIFGIYVIPAEISYIATFITIIFYLVLNWNEIVRFIKKSNSQTGMYKAAQFLIIFGILIFVYLISDTLSWKLDLTESRLYTLSDETVKVLQGITNNLSILYFKPAALTGPYFDYQENLLKAYIEKNNKLKLTKIDPYQNRAMAVDYDIKEDATVVFEYNGSKAYIPFKNIVEMDRDTGKVNYKGEQAFTGAIKSLSLSKPKIVYVLSGHGEINPNDRSNRGYQNIFTRMSQDNIKLNQLNLLKTPEIPENCSLLIIGNPVHTFAVDELDRINTYIAEGGNVLVLLEYETHITINDILRQMGLFYIQNLVIEDQDYNPQLGKTTIIPNYIGSEITLPLAKKNIPVIMPTAVGIQVLDEKFRVSKDKYEITPLLVTSKSSYGEISSNEILSGKVSQDKNDLKGPLTIAYAVKRFITNITSVKNSEETNVVESRMVAFGDSDFINNTYDEKYGNSDLFLNAVNFLLKREAGITIRPKTSEVTGFQLTGSERRFLTIFAFALGFFYIIPGLIIIIRRRSHVKG